MLYQQIPPDSLTTTKYKRFWLLPAIILYARNGRMVSSKRQDRLFYSLSGKAWRPSGRDCPLKLLHNTKFRGIIFWPAGIAVNWTPVATKGFVWIQKGGRINLQTGFSAFFFKGFHRLPVVAHKNFIVQNGNRPFQESVFLQYIVTVIFLSKRFVF